MSDSQVALVTDSTSDLTETQRTELGVTMVPLNLHFENESYQDQIDITSAQFMAKLVTSDELPTTSQPSPALFEQAYKDAGGQGAEVLAIVLSSKLSGTYQSAVLGVNGVEDELTVHVVDSLNASLGLGFQVLRARELANEGQSASDIANQLRAETDLYHLVFFVDTLEYLQKGGRIGKAASVLGGMLKLKPLLRVDEGQVVPYERTRTRAKAIDGLRDFVKSFPHVERLGVLYSTDPADAQALAEELSSEVEGGDVIVSELGPVLAAHLGPRAMGVCVFEGVTR